MNAARNSILKQGFSAPSVTHELCTCVHKPRAKFKPDLEIQCLGMRIRVERNL